ncbi:YfiR family protein [Telluria beijingensis]|uniref:YfiR family protein n=1 Tax=Telluria beijingensis TaxID=3068633 RepID=UPI002795914A|nr:YfiR family protein [Massilia sp. REN29]
MTITQPDRPQRRLACRALALPLLLAGAGAPLLPVAAQAAAPALERRVKAAFLYKFLGYADFPPQAFADAATPLSIGVVGADDMAAELTRIATGRMVAGRTIAVRALREQDLAQSPVHLLFVAGQDGPGAARLLRASPAWLTVTECEGCLQHGSVINFTIVDERVRFDVSLDAAEKKNVKLSSRLLTVANRVQKGAS